MSCDRALTWMSRESGPPRLREFAPPAAAPLAPSSVCRCSTITLRGVAERAEMAKAKVNNRKTLTSRRKQMESKGTFLLDSYSEMKIGNVGSGKAYYQSGK